MNIEIPAVFKELQWFRIQLKLTGSNRVDSAKHKPIEVFQAILEAIGAKLFPQGLPENRFLQVFHFSNQKIGFQWRPNAPIDVQVLFFRCGLQEVEQWKQELRLYFQDETHCKTFHLLDAGIVEPRDFNMLLAEFPAHIPGQGELCLEFLSPLPFKTQLGKSRLYISKNQLIRSLETRFQNLFGKRFQYQSEADDFTLLPYYWEYKELRHGSRSQPGHMQYIKGCLGKLYFKGRWQDLLPFLILGIEIHAGTKRSNSQGYYKIHPANPPHLDTRFPDKEALRQVLKDILIRYDDALESLSREEMFPFDEKVFLDELYTELKENRYTPAPNRAFMIDRESGTPRMVEQLSFKDLTVCQHLLKTVQKPFDAMMEEESLGYRKGISRKKAIDMVEKAVNEGFQYMLDADIESFFSDVDINKLKSLLEAVLPQADTCIKTILFRILDTGYVLKGRLHERFNGIAQGNPLSPVLANLYLDGFDEEIKALDVRLIRYGDDFIIFCRDKDQAEQLLAQTETLLGHLNLSINRDKTAIRPVNHGFQFLGYTFASGGKIKEQSAAAEVFKKPLYITEPYCMLSQLGEALAVKKDKKVIQSFPLRRISEIMVMEKTVFTTGLLKTCTERKIPFTITLDNGYHITTIKPDSKSYFETAYLHGKRFDSLSGSEKLCIAKEFAAHKIKNYISLYKQKYKKGSHELIDTLYEAESRVYQAASIQSVRGGVEGWSTKAIYRGYNRLMDVPFFHFEKRVRKPPDRLNSLMNFGYYLLFSRINATMRAAGLNPYLGFLHSPSDDYESLVCDIQELFRPRIDRLMIKLINLKVITDQDFTHSKHGYYLKRESAKKYLHHFEKEMNHTPSKPGLSLLDQIYLQVDVFKKWAISNRSLSFFHWEI
jgi:CRISP-associated protein Cas1